jgi:lipopolysaccharide export system protein LptA
VTITASLMPSAARVAAALALLAAAPVAAQPAAPGSAPAAKPARPAAATAQEPAADDRASGGRPIEIEADRLEVDQEQEFATFTGNVDAVQGELSLRADRLRVFYTDEGQQQQARAAAADNQGIRRIEAQGDVVLRQPGETAEGDAGVYDPIARTLVLEGNVVLTRGDNVVRGARLDSNLGSGVSVVTAAPGADRSKRVRALFVPEQNEASQ